MEFNTNFDNDYDSLMAKELRQTRGTTSISEHKTFEKYFEGKSVAKQIFINMRSLNKLDIVEPQFFDCGGEYVIIYLNQAKIFRVDRKKFNAKNVESREFSRKIIERNGKKYLILRDKYQMQAFNILTTFSSTYEQVMNLVGNVRDFTSRIKDHRFKLLLVDMLALIIEMRDGFITASKIFAMLLRLYTAYHRYNEIWLGKKLFSQSLGMADLILGYAALGLPTKVIDAMKNVAALTGRRTMDSDFIIDVTLKVMDLLTGVITFFSETAGSFMPPVVASFFNGIFDYIGLNVKNYRLIRKVAEKYTHFLRNEQAIFDPAFREEVMHLRQQCIQSNGFMEYVANNNNKYFKTTWDNFEQNVCKGVKMFDESRRDEPICIVFEGPAGSGKSALMNNFVDLLRKDGMSIYTHSVPSSEDAKDFYDDYENQDVFVMDDVGQQGKSQWRYIINFVAPTKYPLPCAQANKKNTKSFTSKIILCTTNHLRDLESFTSTDCISEPDALRRRIHLIDVRSYDHEGFAQILKYYKYDYKNPNASWVNDFLYHHKNINVTPICDSREVCFERRTKHNLKWLYSLLRGIMKYDSAERTSCNATDKIFADILKECKIAEDDDDIYHDVGMEPQSTCFSYMMEGLYNGVEIATEWTNTIGTKLSELTTSFVSVLSSSILSFMDGKEFKIPVECLPDFCKHFVPTDGLPINLFHVIAIVGIAATITVTLKIFKSEPLEESNAKRMLNDMEAARKRVADAYKDFPEQIRNAYRPQGTRLTSVAQFVKLVEAHSNGCVTVTHGVVSGNKILLPFHFSIDENTRVNLYQSMEHYTNGHIETEKVKLTKPVGFPSVDLTVWEMAGLVPLYKKCKNLFLESASNETDLLLINSMGAVEAKMWLTIKPNSEAVAYEGYVLKNGPNNDKIRVPGRVEHAPWTGVITPLSGEGMCGTILANETKGIFAFHVAGAGEEGFMVVPQGKTRDLIRKYMLEGSEAPFELDNGVIPGFSGARMRYDKDEVKTQYVSTETNLVESAMHVNYSGPMRELIDDLERGRPVPLDKKIPPNFHALGSQKNLLEKISKKTFMHQGCVSEEELNFIQEYMDSMLIDFDDISDNDTAFGSDIVQPLNKESSNGYGWERSKDAYFDFDNKNITEKGREMIESFRIAAENDVYDPRFFMCRETFKDELRKEAKANEPRTFRVMPLPHIFWTKKLCAKLIPHFKKNLHLFGCGVGLNPYTDFDLIYKRLRSCHITGDIDFAKWDGSVVEAIMERISFAIMKHYVGENPRVLDYVLKTMRRSYVLVGDAVYATTHGLPSGTWLTLLMNCLINKSLTALTVYRNMDSAKIEDVNKIVDYVVGDDKIFGVPKEMAKVFNLKTMARTASDLGMTCTNGDKTPITQETQPLEKLNFVKRNFLFHPKLNRIVGALDLSTLVNTLQWVDSTKDLNVVMEGKLRSVQVEAYLHGVGVYTAFMKLLNKYDVTRVLFSEERILQILNDPEGYVDIMINLGKDVSFLKC